MKKSKIFKDPVHGYIEILPEYVSKFVDTPIFQRLRNIEQTSMRPLYPAAHHDRFIHSLGVFHLGKKAFEAIEQNSPSFSIPSDTAKLKTSFEIACLLHDCGHAPYSHTFEYYYSVPPDSSTGKWRILTELEKRISEKFTSDLSSANALPAQHELASATLAMTEYSESIEQFCGEPELVARMITGCKHTDVSDPQRRVENCLIELLNGAPVDVDKLDYIVRDTWASGVKNVSIDVDRLLKSLFVDTRDDRPVLCFYRSALSVIQSVVNGRNYLYRWVYSHHSVLYQAELLKRASDKLAKIISKDDPDSFWKTFISTDILTTPQTVCGRTYFLPSDGDLLALIKEHYALIPDAEELFSRAPKRFPLWKTYAQFYIIFKKVHAQSKALEILEKKASDHLNDKYKTDVGFRTIQAQAKLRGIDDNQILVRIEKENIPFNQLFPQSNKVEKYFFVYAPNELKSERDALIKQLYEHCP